MALNNNVILLFYSVLYVCVTCVYLMRLLLIYVIIALGNLPKMLNYDRLIVKEQDNLNNPLQQSVGGGEGQEANESRLEQVEKCY